MFNVSLWESVSTFCSYDFSFVLLDWNPSTHLVGLPYSFVCPCSPYVSQSSFLPLENIQLKSKVSAVPLSVFLSAGHAL